MSCFACFCFMFAVSLEVSMWVGKINSQKFLRDATVLSYPIPLCRRLDSPYLKLSPSLFLNLWLGFQRQIMHKFSECCFPVGGTHSKLLQEFPCASVAESVSLVLLLSLNWIHMVPKKVFCGLLFHPWEGILFFFILFFYHFVPQSNFLTAFKSPPRWSSWKNLQKFWAEIPALKLNGFYPANHSFWLRQNLG